MDVIVVVLETPRRTYWLYSAPECGLFAFYDGATTFSRVPYAMLEELAVAKKAGLKIEIRREKGVPIHVEGKCVGVKLRPRLTIVRGKYGVYVVRGWQIPVAPEEDLRLLFSVV